MVRHAVGVARDCYRTYCSVSRALYGRVGRCRRDVSCSLPESGSRAKPISRPYVSSTKAAFADASRCDASDSKTQSPAATMGDRIRALMRSSAQPVAIITSLLQPTSKSSEPPSLEDTSSCLVHGATLSSFTTLSLSPIPRIAFSLQLPSRMADSLLQHRPTRSGQGHTEPHFVVNVLASTQGNIAGAFATPGLPPYDLNRHEQDSSSSVSSLKNGTLSSASGREDEDDLHPLAKEVLVPSKKATGVPVLADSVGALACSLEASVDLSDEGTLDSHHLHHASKSLEATSLKGSRLFIARVHDVEAIDSDASRSPRLPLIYWRQTFTSVER